jgi:hypothetical protein
MKTIFNPWQSISGSICLNIFICLVDSEPEKIDDLAIPICCSLYLSKNWKRLNFSNTDKINDLRKYVSPETLGIPMVFTHLAQNTLRFPIVFAHVLQVFRHLGSFDKSLAGSCLTAAGVRG